MNKLFFTFLVVAASAISCLAVEPLVWSVDSRADVLKGDARGVSIGDTGLITLAPKLTEIFKTEQPYIWSSVVDSAGNVYLGTGGDGKIFKVDATGKGSMIVDLNEMNVSALALGAGGELFAATSPDGKVYRIDASGRSTVYFEPKEKYIWSLAVMNDGSLAVGTGDGGKLFRVRTANATAESSLIFDSTETNIISLATDKQGNLYAGSDPGGIVYRIGADGKPFGLMDSPLREIHAIDVGPDGSIYVLALGESASATKPADSAAAPPAENKTVTVDKPNPANPEPASKSRYDLANAKTAVYRILPDGGTSILWASATVTGFSIRSHPDGVLIGTSEKGRLYNISNEGRETLAMQTGASQISTLRGAGSAVYATSSNQGSLYRIGPETVAEGTYDSAVLDARGSAAWGRIWWRSSGTVQIQTRSGNTEKPDDTWSAWSTALTDMRGAKISSPKSRYIQWRAVLRASADRASLEYVNVAFVGRNIAPEVLSLTVLPTNVGLVPNPPLQIDPNIELSGMDPVTFGIPNAAVPPRRVYQRGATSLQWTAEDRNGDKLVYDIYYREIGDTKFKLLRADQAENFISIDGYSLADGRYIFKVVAKDTPSNPANLALSGERATEPINIDNTPPVVSVVGTPQITSDRGRFVFDAVDAASYLVRAEYSVNGGDWHSVYADDGISDSPNERYTVDIPVAVSGEYVVTIRVFDVNGNAGNARAVIRR